MTSRWAPELIRANKPRKRPDEVTSVRRWQVGVCEGCGLPLWRDTNDDTYCEGCDD